MCWLRHKWTKWVEYVHHYGWVPNRGVNAGKTFECSELRQKRTCERCGWTQDELIR